MSCPMLCHTCQRTTRHRARLALTVTVIFIAATIACGGGTPVERVSSPPSPKGVTGTPAAFVGIDVNQLNTPAPNIPIASLRMWDDHTAWSEINTSPGPPTASDFANMDYWLGQTSVYGTDFLYDLARTPGWAQCPNNSPPCGSGLTPPACFDADVNGPGQCLPPSDLNFDGSGPNQIWINWVTAVAQHSVQSTTGHITYYEIWNEPNVPSEWQGSILQLVRMTQDASCIIKGTNCSSLSTYSQTGVDPAASILTPAFVNLDSNADVLNGLTAFFNAGGSQYIDVIAFHGYVGNARPPEDFATTFLPSISGLVASMGKPLFNTEGSWGTKQPITDPQEQAAWLSRYILIQVSESISKFYWYSWDGGPVGLWSATGGTSPAGIAYGILGSQWLKAGATISACAPQNPQSPVWTCNLTRPGGYQAQAVWNAAQTCSGTCTSSTYTVPSQFVQYMDTAGNTTSLNGATTVQIGAVPILLETGSIP